MRPTHINLVFALAASLAVSGLACRPAAALTSELVQKVIKETKLWSDSGQVAVACSNNQVIISTYRPSAENDRDCKIDTVLILRNILRSDPDITRLTVRFYEPLKPHNFKEIEVRQSDIAAFGNQLIDEDKLLSGISVTAGVDLPQVVAGPFGEARAAAKQHIAELQNKGIGIAAYMRLFSDVEELASSANAEAQSDEATRKGFTVTVEASGAAGKTAEGTASVTGEKPGEPTMPYVGKPSEATMEKLRTALNLLMQKLDEQEAAARQLKSAQKTAAKAGAGKPVASANPGSPQATDSYSKVQSLGSFSPAEGPYLLDRIQIARKLSELQGSGTPIQNYRAVWKRMDANANQHLPAAVKADVDYLFTQLGLPPITDAQRQQTTLVKIKN